MALVLAPGLLHGNAAAVAAWWRSLAVGLGVLVAGPVAVLLAAVTLVGLPLALIGLAAYLLGLYAAKIVVGLFLGRALLGDRGPDTRASLRALVVGVLLLTVASEIPLAGPVVGAVVMTLGLGALASWLYRTARFA